jgi:hypothetical protein
MKGRRSNKLAFLASIALVFISGARAFCLRSLNLKDTSLSQNIKSWGRALAIIVSINANIVHPNLVIAKLDDMASINRFKASLSELERLDREWTKYQSNGDDIRRILGTVYSPPSCDSPLCSSEAFVQKFVRGNMDELDFEAFEGPSSKYLRALNQADFLAYSSIFAGYGNGGSGVDYIEESHKQVKKAIVQLKDMISVITQE